MTILLGLGFGVLVFFGYLFVAYVSESNALANVKVMWIVVIVGIVLGGYIGHTMDQESARYKKPRTTTASTTTTTTSVSKDKDNSKCPICGKTFDDNENITSIKFKNMCTQCYKNFDYANEMNGK